MMREEIYGALFAQVPQDVFQFTSRKVALFADLQAKPALCQAEHDEEFRQTSRLPYKIVLKATWLLYWDAQPDTVPAQTMNPLLDTVQDALAPGVADPGYCEDRNTLGGLVWHCFIDGKIVKIPGDLDGQGLAAIPISILVP